MMLGLLVASTGVRHPTITSGATDVWAPSPTASEGLTSDLQRAFRHLLVFEPNIGQAEDQFGFLARGSNFRLLLGRASVSLAASGSLGGQSVRMRLLGGDPDVSPIGVEPLPGVVNSFLGSDASVWRSGVPTYAGVAYPGIYPGVDLIFYARSSEIEYDLIVAPGTNPEVIRLGVEGSDDLEIDHHGDLRILTDLGEFRQRAPRVYQQDGSAEIAARYVLLGDGQVGFEIGDYDAASPLVIDPVLVYSTYIGTSQPDEGNGLAVDASGHAYLTGRTGTADPNVFVAKLSPDGSQFSYITYLGGPHHDDGQAIAVDALGNAYVAGQTYSSSFPTTVGAYDRTCGTDGACNGVGITEDAFLSKLGPQGTLLYSTYLGGGGEDKGLGIAVDAASNVYVTGQMSPHGGLGAGTPSFPTKNALQPQFGGGHRDAFIAKLSLQGNGHNDLLFSTYFGGNGDDRGHAIAVGTDNSVYVGGFTQSTNFPAVNSVQGSYGGDASDAWVARLSPSGTGLVFSTYLGGSGPGQETVRVLALDSAGAAYVAGETGSTNFPRLNPFQPNHAGGDYDGFVAKLTAQGALAYATYLGVNGDDSVAGLAVDPAGAAYVAGGVGCPSLPITERIQAQPGPGGNSYVARLSPAGNQLTFGTCFGGNGSDNPRVALDATHVYVGGITTSTNLSTSNAAQPQYAGGETDGFVMKISLTTVTPPPSACTLFPIAIHRQTTAGLQPGALMTNILNGAGPGNFGWLTWTGSPSEPTLVRSLTPPGDSQTYTNPLSPADHVVSVGDWVQGKPGTTNSQAVRSALDTLKTVQITVPLWDSAEGQGNNARYRVAGFARVQLTDYRLPGESRISARFLGSAECA